MRSKVLFSSILFPVLFTFIAGAFAQQAEDIEAYEAQASYYRCQAIGKSEKGYVQGENENSLLEYAMRYALRDCQRKGGQDCKIVHCFKE